MRDSSTKFEKNHQKMKHEIHFLVERGFIAMVNYKGKGGKSVRKGGFSIVAVIIMNFAPVVLMIIAKFALEKESNNNNIK